jgi:hypothetical protein
MLAKIGLYARESLAGQIATDGSLPKELSRTRPRHYVMFTLQGWTAPARVLSRSETIFGGIEPPRDRDWFWRCIGLPRTWASWTPSQSIQSTRIVFGRCCLISRAMNPNGRAPARSRRIRSSPFSIRMEVSRLTGFGEGPDQSGCPLLVADRTPSPICWKSSFAGSAFNDSAAIA